MELTEVIRPVHQIIVGNGLPFGTKSLDNANLDCEVIKENDVPEFSEEMRNRNMNKEIISESDTQETFIVQPHASMELNDHDNMQLPKISENDEVQIVGMITFCEPADENVASRATKSSIRGSHRAKPVQYAVFFSSDESDDNSSFEISSTKIKTSKRKTVIPAQSSKPSEKTRDTISHDNVFPESENAVKKNDLLKCSIDVLHPEKSEKLGKKSTKKLKDIKISKSKDDLPKHSSEKCSVTSKDANFKANNVENIKKLGSSHENDLPKHSSDKSTPKDGNIKLNEDVNVKKVKPNHGKDFPKQSSASKHKPYENFNVKKLGLNHEKDMPKHSSHKSKDKNIKPDDDVTVKKKALSNHENLKTSPGKKARNFQTTKETGSETPLNRDLFSDNLDDTITIESPESESRKVSFADFSDLVSKLRKMSVSKQIAENKKVRRTSKSVLDFEELLEQEAQSKILRAGVDNFSESTNGQKKIENPVILDITGDTELYSFPPSNNNFLIPPTADDLMSKFSLNATQKSVKKSSKTSKKVLPSSKPLKSTDKLSLKKRKDNPKNTEPKVISDEIFKERDILSFESPVSVSKPAKRKSLFKENLDDDSKENIDHQIQNKTKNILQETDKTITNASTELSALNNVLKKSTSTKNQRKTKGKFSLKKLSDKHKKLEPTPEIKKKKHSVAMKSLENSPVLRDTVNLPETVKYTEKIRLLEEEIDALKAAKSTNDKDMQNLKEELSESHVENSKSEKIIHDQCETISTLENETKILRKEIESLEEKLAELNEAKKTCDMELKTDFLFSDYNSSLASESLNSLLVESSMPFENSSGLGTEGENWCSQLGLSESDFFSSDAAKEMLKKDKEIFEKEQFPPTSKISDVSNWSPPSQLEITAPSWFQETSSSQLLDSDHRISIGRLFGARSENLGTLSNDNERERPYFGAVATTPPKSRETLDSSVAKVNAPVVSSITVAIETPTLCETLDFITISATVGHARLILKDTDKNPLILKAAIGATCSHSVTVMNDGSLSVYDIKIEGDNDVLCVSPMSLNLQPKQCATLSVTFTPQTYCFVKRSLLAAARPHGQVFTLTEIIGQVQESYRRSQSNNPPVRNTRPTRDSVDSIIESSFGIECNERYLAWGGNDIGNIASKKF